MTKAEQFIYNFEGDQKEIMLYFHDLLVSELNLTDKIKFDIPFYYRKSWICYLNPLKNRNVELAFTRGNELSNVQGILESKGRKQVFGIEIKKLSDAPIREINEIIQEAILLDENVAYDVKRKIKT